MKQKWFLTLASVLLLTMSHSLYGQKAEYTLLSDPESGRARVSLTHPEIDAASIDMRKNLEFTRDADIPSGIRNLAPHGVIRMFAYYMQEPSSFIEKAKSCFTRRELKSLCDNDIRLVLTPIINDDGLTEELYSIDIESLSDTRQNVKKMFKSLARLENAFCDYFTFNDGGLRKLFGIQRSILRRAYILHFSPDGSITVDNEGFPYDVPYYYDSSITVREEQAEDLDFQNFSPVRMSSSAKERVYCDMPNEAGRHQVSLTHPEIDKESIYPFSSALPPVSLVTGNVSHPQWMPMDTFLMQDPDSFVETAKSCFSRKELKTLCEADVLISMTPIVGPDVSSPILYNFDIESVSADLDIKKLYKSLARLENAFCGYFTFNDGGVRRLYGIELSKIDRAYTLHFSPDGNVSVDNTRYSLRWLYAPDTKTNTRGILDYGVEPTFGGKKTTAQKQMMR